MQIWLNAFNQRNENSSIKLEHLHEMLTCLAPSTINEIEFLMQAFYHYETTPLRQIKEADIQLVTQLTENYPIDKAIDYFERSIIEVQLAKDAIHSQYHALLDSLGDEFQKQLEGLYKLQEIWVSGLNFHYKQYNQALTKKNNDTLLSSRQVILFNQFIKEFGQKQHIKELKSNQIINHPSFPLKIVQRDDEPRLIPKIIATELPNHLPWFVRWLPWLFSGWICLYELFNQHDEHLLRLCVQSQQYYQLAPKLVNIHQVDCLLDAQFSLNIQLAQEIDRIRQCKGKIHWWQQTTKRLLRQYEDYLVEKQQNSITHLFNNLDNLLDEWEAELLLININDAQRSLRQQQINKIITHLTDIVHHNIQSTTVHHSLQERLEQATLKAHQLSQPIHHWQKELEDDANSKNTINYTKYLQLKESFCAESRMPDYMKNIDLILVKNECKHARRLLKRIFELLKDDRDFPLLWTLPPYWTPHLFKCLKSHHKEKSIKNSLYHNLADILAHFENQLATANTIDNNLIVVNTAAFLKKINLIVQLAQHLLPAQDCIRLQPCCSTFQKITQPLIHNVSCGAELKNYYYRILRHMIADYMLSPQALSPLDNLYVYTHEKKLINTKNRIEKDQQISKKIIDALEKIKTNLIEIKKMLNTDAAEEDHNTLNEMETSKHHLENESSKDLLFPWSIYHTATELHKRTIKFKTELIEKRLPFQLGHPSIVQQERKNV